MWHSRILVLLLGVALAGCSRPTSQPTSSDFGPLEPMLSKWTGEVEMTISSDSGEKVVSYTKTTECRIAESRDEFLMVDHETNPWTNEKCTMTSVIKLDPTSGKYKATVNGTDGSCQHFVIEKTADGLAFEMEDSASGDESASNVRFQKDGTILEEGSRSSAGPNPFLVKWTARYTR